MALALGPTELVILGVMAALFGAIATVVVKLWWRAQRERRDRADDEPLQ